MGIFSRAMMAALQAALGEKQVATTPPPGRVRRVSPAEVAEPPRRKTRDHSSGWSALIVYRDSKGQQSERDITVRGISGHYGQPEVITAYCHARELPRAFRIDRIEQMACLETGEMLDPVEQCLALHRGGALTIEDKALTKVATVLAFMARCDAEFHALERQAFEDLLGRYMRFFGGDDRALECAVREGLRLAPAGEDVIRALKAIGGMPSRRELAGFVLDSCGRMVDADGVQREEEFNWLLQVDAALKKLAAKPA